MDAGIAVITHEAASQENTAYDPVSSTKTG